MNKFEVISISGLYKWKSEEKVETLFVIL